DAPQDRGEHRLPDRQRGGHAEGARHRRAGGGAEGRVEAEPGRLLRDDRADGEGVPEHQAGGDDAPRGAFDQPARLGGGAVAGGEAVRQPDVSARRDRPDRRRGRVRQWGDLRADGRPLAGGVAAARGGARGFADDLPRRRGGGPGGGGGGVRQGRVGPGAAITANGQRGA